MDANIIKTVQDFGFDVYMRDQEKDSWLIFTDGDNLGYLQSRNGEIELSTVHLPNSWVGTGFRVCKEGPNLTKGDLERCFSLAPPWAVNKDKVKKWRGIEHFRKADPFNAGYKLVPKER